ncbi:SRPBCC family protein [Pseudomonas akapageensis]|uniref:SRPBCC family protein n=1 Tax=Pseudomonas akapageensis TaxID=2609961 RepID=UPI003CCE11B4
MTDRIEREVRLKASRAEVWKVLADAQAFGEWFGVALQGKQFKVGSQIKGPITHPGYEHITWEVHIDRIEPDHLLSFLWHPYAIDPKVDYSHETPTRVVFQLQELAEGTLLRLVESGFDKIPATRRDEAYKMHCDGWDQQMINIGKYLEQKSLEPENRRSQALS